MDQSNTESLLPMNVVDRPMPPISNSDSDYVAENNHSDDVINHPPIGYSSGFRVSNLLKEIAQSDEATAIAIRRAMEEEIKIVDDDNDSTGSAALRAIMRRGVCRMPVVVGIGPDGRRTTGTSTTPTMAEINSQQNPRTNPNCVTDT